jgi:hypothetical protein
MPKMVLVPRQGTVSPGIIAKLQNTYLTLKNGEEKVANILIDDLRKMTKLSEHRSDSDLRSTILKIQVT